MKTDARLALSLRQRRFEWALARDEQGRTAGRLVAGKTHDLLNLIQIIRLGARLLEEHCDARARELVADLERAADDSQRARLSNGRLSAYFTCALNQSIISASVCSTDSRAE
jgi:hypothetical protein